jgi:hypothetical protein
MARFQFFKATQAGLTDENRDSHITSCRWSGSFLSEAKQEIDPWLGRSRVLSKWAGNSYCVLRWYSDVLSTPPSIILIRQCFLRFPSPIGVIFRGLKVMYDQNSGKSTSPGIFVL